MYLNDTSTERKAQLQILQTLKIVKNYLIHVGISMKDEWLPACVRGYKVDLASPGISCKNQEL